MAWKFTSDRPIYTQIAETIRQDIISGKYKMGERLPSVRDFASEAAVNPNTMQRALLELESEGLITTQRTSGRLITSDPAVIETVRTRLAKEIAADFLNKMKQMGNDKQKALQILENLEKELTP